MNTTVNFEIAKLLKEKGFDEPCNHVHYENKTYAYTKSGGVRNSHKKEQQWVCTAPTIAEVVMWLYEKHGIWITPHPNHSFKYWSVNLITNKNAEDNLYPATIYNSPTEAYKAAIEYILKHLI